MVDAGAHLCVAFFQPGAANKGTQITVDFAEKANIPIRKY
jgi:hypothetical protein